MMHQIIVHNHGRVLDNKPGVEPGISPPAYSTYAFIKRNVEKARQLLKIRVDGKRVWGVLSNVSS